jgi:endonuclease YncB( thermonuclease family)
MAQPYPQDCPRLHLSSLAVVTARLCAASLAIIVLWLAAAALAEPITGKPEVVDGDTIKINGITIRLWGIDAPEGRQECVRRDKAWLPGPEATEALRGLLARPGGLSCEPRGRKDRNGRTVALCRIGSLDIGGEMVRLGWALDYPAYSGGLYAKPEAEARTAKRGVWPARCSTPWEWRAERR